MTLAGVSDRLWPAQGRGDGVQGAVQHVHGEGLQAKVVALPQERGAGGEPQCHEWPVAAGVDRLGQDFGGAIEPARHVPRRPAGRWRRARR